MTSGCGAGVGLVDKSIEVELPRDASAPSRARHLIGELGAHQLDPSELDRAKVVVSELVTNAVLHGQGRIALRASLNQDRLLVEVIDEGSGFERVARDLTFEDLHGRGLNIVDSEASRWGLHEGTTHVWFEIERSGPRLGGENAPATDAFD
jgi:anti-sigma regulatory factor (Ser/Thr protein kinase)